MSNNESMDRKISTDFDKSFDALLQIEAMNRTKIPEELFKGVFLGLFANLEHQHPEATIQNWIGIAGSPFNAVDVVANNQVIFTVPPIFSKDAIKPQELNRGEPLSHVVAIAEKLSMRSPIEGQNYIDNKYAAASRKLQNGVDRLAYAKEWNAILKRYNLPEMVEMAGQPETKVGAVRNDILDELRSDDLDFTMI